MSTRKTVRIEVTDDDIAEGCPHQPGSCPIARAARRAGIPWVRVGGSTLRYGTHGPRGRVALPEAAAVFVSRFDRRLSVGPFAFSVRITADTPNQRVNP